MLAKETRSTQTPPGKGEEIVKEKKFSGDKFARSAPPNSIRYDKSARYPYPVLNRSLDPQVIQSRISALRSKTASNSLPPISLEDFRTKVVRDISHQSILAIGVNVNNKLEETIEDEKRRIIQETEDAIWSVAEKEKDRVLKEMKQKMEDKEKRNLDKMKRQHQRELHEKLAALESVLRRESAEALEAEDNKWKQVVESTIDKLNTEWSEKLRIAVIEAKSQEKKEAEKQIVAIKAEHAEEIKTQRKILIGEKEAALEQQKQTMKKKMHEKIQRTKADEHEKRMKSLAEQEDRYEKQISELMDLMEMANQSQVELRLSMEGVKAEKALSDQEVLRTRELFMEFIHRVLRLHPGQGDYVLPLDEIASDILANMETSPLQETYKNFLFDAKSARGKSKSDSISSLQFMHPPKDQQNNSVCKISQEFI